MEDIRELLNKKDIILDLLMKYDENINVLVIYEKMDNIVNRIKERLKNSNKVGYSDLSILFSWVSYIKKLKPSQEDVEQLDDILILIGKIMKNRKFVFIERIRS